MKKTLIASFMAVGGMALALPTQAGKNLAAPGQPAILVAQAGHDHGAAGHADKGQAHDLSHAKVSTTVTVSSCWIRAVPPPAPSAGYFLVKNAGNKDVKLQGASSADYGMVMLHQTTQQDGMSKMSETHDVVIPAAGQLEFKPGSYHAMLEKPAKAAVIGSKVNMDFLFDTGEKASAECEIKPANTQAPMSH